MLLLLHGFPTPSHMFHDLIPRLANHYRVVAPDIPDAALHLFDTGHFALET